MSEEHRGNLFQKFLTVLVYILLFTLIVALFIPVCLIYVLRSSIKLLWIVLTIRVQPSDTSIQAVKASATLATVNHQATQLLQKTLGSLESSVPAWTNTEVPMDENFIYPLGEEAADPFDVVNYDCFERLGDTRMLTATYSKGGWPIPPTHGQSGTLCWYLNRTRGMPQHANLHHDVDTMLRNAISVCQAGR